ncbi:MAG: glycosyltransferase [Caldilineaceae bacterium]
MRVLQIYKDYAPVMGGIENHIRELAQGLRQHNVEARVLATNTTGQTVHEVIDGIPVTKTGRQLNISSAPISLGFYPWLRRLEKDVDIAHLHLPYPPGELGQLLLGRSKRLVLTYHSDIVRQKVLGALYAPFLHHVLQRADLIAVSNPVYVHSSRFLPRVADKCRVIPFGIDLARFAATPPVHQRAAEIRHRFDNKPLLLFVGRLRHYKGVNILLDAMCADAIQQLEARLLIIGIGPLQEQLQRQAAAADLLDRVTFGGEWSDADKIAAYHAADLFVLPSINRAETLGIVQIEAMACGTPVVSTELGTGTSWVNQHQQTGLVAPPNDPAALAKAIAQLLGDAERRRAMGQTAYRRAHGHFSKEAMTRQTIEFYQEALQY